MTDNIAGELPAGIIEKEHVKHNIRVALKYYRYLKAFAENAVDSVDWYINDRTIPTHIQSITQSRMETLTYIAHIDKALETFKQLCIAEGKERTANVILRKFVDPPLGMDKKGKPFTNEALAGMFDVDESTIKRDIRESWTALSILFFGLNGLDPKKGA